MDGSWAKFGCWVLDVFSLRYTGEEVRMIGESQAAAGRNQRNDLRSARACARVHARERERERNDGQLLCRPVLLLGSKAKGRGILVLASNPASSWGHSLLLLLAGAPWWAAGDSIESFPSSRADCHGMGRKGEALMGLEWMQSLSWCLLR